MRLYDVKLIAAQKHTVKSLAIHYGIPEYVVGVVLRKEHLESIGHFWDEIAVKA